MLKYSELNVNILKIEFSKEQDVQRISGTLTRLRWYQMHGYTVNIPHKLSDTSNMAEIQAEVLSQYNSSEYEKCAEELTAFWALNELMFERANHVLPSLIDGQYTVVLTKYGVAGSCDCATRSVILNIIAKPNSKLGARLIHEIVHIRLEPLIQQYQIFHEAKERLVDLICGDLFPGFSKMQMLGSKANLVDAIYKQSFPDLELTIRSIKVLQQNIN